MNKLSNQGGFRPDRHCGHPPGWLCRARPMLARGRSVGIFALSAPFAHFRLETGPEHDPTKPSPVVWGPQSASPARAEQLKSDALKSSGQSSGITVPPGRMCGSPIPAAMVPDNECPFNCHPRTVPGPKIAPKGPAPPFEGGNTAGRAWGAASRMLRRQWRAMGVDEKWRRVPRPQSETLIEPGQTGQGHSLLPLQLIRVTTFDGRPRLFFWERKPAPCK